MTTATRLHDAIDELASFNDEPAAGGITREVYTPTDGAALDRAGRVGRGGAALRHGLPRQPRGRRAAGAGRPRPAPRPLWDERRRGAARCGPAVIERHHGSGRVGVGLDAPFMTLSFLALSVIPDVELTDRGLVDVARARVVPLTV